MTAICLFNEHGFMNVLNQEIAEEAGISLSNFNYHFPSKKDLMLAICIHMSEMLEEQILNTNILTEKNNLDIPKIYLEFEKQFVFFYLDTHNILKTYPSLKETLQKQIDQSIKIIKNLNFMAIGKGNMKPEPKNMPDLYAHLSEQIWMNMHFWFASCTIRSNNEDIIIKGLESSYAIIYPYLTEKGRGIYMDYIEKLKTTK